MPRQVFISHAAVDHAQAGKIVDALEQRGIACWISSRLRDLPPGKDYASSIAAAIEASCALVLLFSRNANKSQEIPKELALATQLHIPVISVKIEKAEPAGSLKYQMAASQYVNLFEDVPARLDELCARLADIVEDDGAVRRQIIRRRKLDSVFKTLRQVIVLAVFAMVLAVVGWTQRERLLSIFAPEQQAILLPAKPPAPPPLQTMPAPAAPVPVPVKPLVSPAPAVVVAAPKGPPNVASQPATPATASKTYMAVNNTALRETAEPFGTVIETLEVGDIVTATAQGQTDPVWLRVMAQDGQAGYVSSQDLAAQ